MKINKKLLIEHFLIMKGLLKIICNFILCYTFERRRGNLRMFVSRCLIIFKLAPASIHKNYY